MKSALSDKMLNGNLIVLESLDFEVPKTKEMIKVLEAIKADRKALIVTDVKNENVVKSANNIPGVNTALATTMNVYEIVNAGSLILTKEAVQLIEEVYK